MSQLKIVYAARSDAGRVRRNNEDNLYCNGNCIFPERVSASFSESGKVKMPLFEAKSDGGPFRILTKFRNLPERRMTPLIFSVFDGMGAYQDGEIASFEAANTLREMLPSEIYLSTADDTDPSQDNRSESGDSEFDRTELIISGSPSEGKHPHLHSYSDSLSRFMDRYLEIINRKINRLSSNPVGTTLAAVAIFENHAVAYNIGDSRIYLLNDCGLIKLSTDHTLADRKIKDGVYDESYARRTDDWNKLTACVGIFKNNDEIFPYHRTPPIPLSAGDKILICSDGLTDMVYDTQIETILRKSDPKQAAKKLMSEALNNGGVDNTTLIVIAIS